MTRQQAWELLRRYNAEPFHLRHALTVEGVMRCFAEQRGYDPEFWGIVGLLHDIDFEQWPEQHCVKAPELLREGGAEESIIHAVCSHGWAICVDIKPEHEMEKLLYAADELTGLIGAAALMRPLPPSPIPRSRRSPRRQPRRCRPPRWCARPGARPRA